MGKYFVTITHTHLYTKPSQHPPTLQLFFHQLTHTMNIILLIIGGAFRPGIMKLFPARESLVSDIPAGNGKIVNLFYSVSFALFSALPSIRRAPSFVVIKYKQILKYVLGEGWRLYIFNFFTYRIWKSAKIVTFTVITSLFLAFEVSRYN